MALKEMIFNPAGDSPIAYGGWLSDVLIHTQVNAGNTTDPKPLNIQTSECTTVIVEANSDHYSVTLSTQPVGAKVEIFAHGNDVTVLSPFWDGNTDIVVVNGTIQAFKCIHTWPSGVAWAKIV